MIIKQIGLAECMNMIYEGGNAYMMIPIDNATTVEMLNKAEAYCILVDEPKLEDYKPIEPEGPEEEPEEVPEPEPEPEKPEPKKQKIEIDHGKICALYKAGWNCTKIADELRCNAQTVINHLVKEGIYKKRGE